MRLVAQDVATQEKIITFLVPATRRRNLIRATFPFGGRYVGRYDPGPNIIVGHFAGFAHRGRPNIPAQPFAMTNVVSAAAPPVN